MSDWDLNNIERDAKARLASLKLELEDAEPGTWWRKETEHAIERTQETLDLIALRRAQA